jgi:hypothetical protein
LFLEQFLSKAAISVQSARFYGISLQKASQLINLMASNVIGTSLLGSVPCPSEVARETVLTSSFAGLDKVTFSLDSFKMDGLHGIFHTAHGPLSI